MIHSKEKSEDMAARLQMLKDADDCLKWYEDTKYPGALECAKEWLRMAKIMKERIDTLDYTERDNKRAKLDRIFGI